MVYTLSAAVQSLDKAAQQAEQQQQQMTPAEADLKAAVIQASQSNAETTHLDGQPVLDLENLARDFRPFVPPPPPVPMPDMNEETSSNREHDVSNPAMELPCTTAEQDQLDDSVRQDRQPFLKRMLQRQEMLDRLREERDGMVWRAISVRRQRKLKMKKHKYKKLMRRTRNLRRKQDKL